MLGPEKTALEYLDDLPEPIRSEAITEAREQDLSTLTGYCHSLQSALTLAFLWSFTAKGYDYWYKVMRGLVKKDLIS